MNHANHANTLAMAGSSSAGLQLLPSNKGTHLLALDGFTYSQHSMSKNGLKIYWRCTDRAGCNARVHTNVDLANLRLLKDTSPHIGHIEDFRSIEGRKVVQSIKRKAREQPNEAPNRVSTEEQSTGQCFSYRVTYSREIQIIRQAIGAVNDPEVLAKLPERQSVRRVVNIHQNIGRPRNPRILQDIVLDAPYTTTQRSTRFLLFDSGGHQSVVGPWFKTRVGLHYLFFLTGIDDPDRVVVFCSEESLKVLCLSDVIYADGTFKTVPNQFGQCYSIHGVIKDVASRRYVFPLAFCLCVRKNETTYSLLWNAIKDEAAALDLRFRVTLMMTDFEIAAMNVQQRLFPGVEHKGCLFHFNQSLWRYVVNNGLKVLYNNPENDDHTIRRDVQRLMALPFVPLDDLEVVFDAVTDEVDDRVVSVCTHLENTYIRGHRPLRRRHAVPALWNVHQQAVEDTARTNNVVEGWHSKFQKMIVVHHANVWKYIDELKAEEHDFHQIHAQVKAGHINVKQPVNKKYEMCQRRLHNIANSYEEYKERGETFTYLEAIAYNIKVQPE